jgi:hypothetical protein
MKGNRVFVFLVTFLFLMVVLMAPVLASSHSISYDFDGRMTGEQRYEAGDNKTASIYSGSGAGKISSVTVVDESTLTQSFAADITADGRMTVIRAIKSAIEPAESDTPTDQVHAIRLSAYLGGMLVISQEYIADDIGLLVDSETYISKGRLDRRMVVGARGFEPPASWSRTKRATKLRYAPLL